MCEENCKHEKALQAIAKFIGQLRYECPVVLSQYDFKFCKRNEGDESCEYLRDRIKPEDCWILAAYELAEKGGE